MRFPWLAVPTIILLAGLLFWYSQGPEPDRNSELGAALISGALVSVAVLFIERRQTQESEKRNMQFTLATREVLDQTNLSGYDLSKTAFLRGKQLKNANFQGAKLDRADLSNTSLDGANFKGASLKNTDFAGCSLKNVKFHKANLKGANFAGAELEKAEFYEADIRGANFDKMSRAVAEEMASDIAYETSRFVSSLLGVLQDNYDRDEAIDQENLQSLTEPAKSLRTAKLQQAWYNSSTKWPEGIDPAAFGTVEIGGPLKAISVIVAKIVSQIAGRTLRRLVLVLLPFASSPADLRILILKTSALAGVVAGVAWLSISAITILPSAGFGDFYEAHYRTLLLAWWISYLITLPAIPVALGAFYEQRRKSYGKLGKWGFLVCLIGALTYATSDLLYRLYASLTLRSVLLDPYRSHEIFVLDVKRIITNQTALFVLAVGLLLVGVAAFRRRKRLHSSPERRVGSILILEATLAIVFLLGLLMYHLYYYAYYEVQFAEDAYQLFVNAFGYEIQSVPLPVYYLLVGGWSVSIALTWFTIGYLLWPPRSVADVADAAEPASAPNK